MKSISSIFLLLSLFSASLVKAQSDRLPNNQDLVVGLGINAINQFNSDLSSGGNFSLQSGSAYLNILKPVSTSSTVALGIRYDSQFWKWSNMGGYGQNGQQPWKNVNSSIVSLGYSHRISPEWQLGLVPTIESSGEQGINFENSLTYGAVVSAAKVFSPSLRLGFGAGVFRQIDTTRVFPYLVIDWKITDRWSLNNPLPAGPAGGAGLELTYAVTPQLKISGGGTYRSYRFRLNDSGPYAGGVGQNSLFPVFAKLTYAFDKTSALDIYALMNLGGTVSASDTHRNDLFKTNYKPTPALAISFIKRF